MKFNVIKNLSLASLAFGACLAFTGCRMFELHNSNLDALFLQEYCSNDPVVADRALTNYRNSYENRQDWAYKVAGYDTLYTLIDARQMEVNQALNRPEFVDIYYRSATNRLTQTDISQGKQPEFWTLDDVKAIADKADKGLAVGWKK